MEKRNSLPKSFLDKDYGFPIQNEVASPQYNLVDAKSQRVEKFKASLQDAEIQSLRSSSSVAPNSCIALLQERHCVSMQQFLEQNAVGLDRTLKRSNVNSTRGNGQLSDGVTKNERLKKIKLSTEDYQLQSIDKDLGVIAHISNTYASPEDLSESMHNMFMQNADDAEPLSTGVLNVQTINQHFEDAETETRSTGADGQAARQGSISEELICGNSDAFVNEQCLPNVSDGDKCSRVCSDISAKVNDPADLVKDAFDKEKGEWQHAPIKGHEGNIHPALDVTPPVVVRDVNSCDAPLNIDIFEDAFSCEKHNSQVTADGDSAIYSYAKGGFCIKCKKGGEVSICCGSGCFISVHKTCLGAASLKFDKSGLFFCPLCSYKRAVIACRKGKERFYQACKLLSDFTGRDFVQGFQGEWSPLCVLPEAIQMRDVNSSCSELNVGSSQSIKGARDKLIVTSTEANEVTQSFDDRQVDFLEPQLPGKHSNNDHFQEDPCHDARFVHGVVQGASGLINENLHMHHDDQEEKKGQGTVGEESPSQKNGNSRGQDEMVVDDHPSYMTSSGKRGEHRVWSKLLSTSMPPLKRRSKLRWTAAEIEYLTEAVNKLDEEYTFLIPWAYILEEGNHVFHKSREPGDLKDKWRNIKKKSGFKCHN